MKSAKKMERSIKKLTVESGDRINGRILDKLLRKLDESKGQASTEQIPIWSMIGNGKVGKLAAACLIISLCLACYVLSGKVTDLKAELELARRDTAIAQRDIALVRQEAAIAPTDHSTTINLYLREHQGAVARTAALEASPPPSARMQVNQRDVLYYEYFDGEPGFMQPGIIIRGPSSEQQFNSSGTPAIANGHTLTLAEARATSTFALKAPPRLYPGYRLKEIRRIEGRDALHLVYTNGISGLSLFEQRLDGNRRLGAQDFREYAVYLNQGQGGRAILAWKDDTLSYVLIGTHEMSQLMNMAQSISAAN